MRPRTHDTLSTAMRDVSRRLARRRALAWASVGAWIGAAASALWLGSWLLRWLPLPHFAWLLAPIAVVAAVAAAIGGFRFRADPQDLALVVDRVLQSEEVAVTALGLNEGDRVTDSPLAGQVLADVETALDGSAGTIKDRLPVQPPRHVRWLPLALLAVAAMTLLPRVPVRAKPAGPAGDLAAEADRLVQRKDELERERGAELPDELEAELDQLLEAMKDGSIGKDDAAAQAEDLAEKLNEHARQNSDGAAQALRDAAESLERVDPELAEDLKDAMSDADLEAAQEAVERMRERMEQASPEERERAAEELERAAQEAMKSPAPGLGGALQGEAGMLRKQSAGQQGQQGQQGAQGGQQSSSQGNQQGGQQGQQGQGGQQGGQQQGQQGGQQQGQQGGQQGGQQAGGQGQQQGGEQGQSGGQSGGSGLSEYLEQLQQQGVGGDGLAEGEAQNQLNQQMEQALGGAAGRLGGKGATGQQGQGQGGTASWGAGSDHTDEDEGTFDTSGVGHQDMDRQVDGRNSDWVVPFDQQHAPERLEGVNAVASTVDVPLGNGPVDVEHFRLSGSDETAGAPLLQAPAGYREAAEEAIEGEQVPRAYRDQVKTYFDAIE